MTLPLPGVRGKTCAGDKAGDGSGASRATTRRAGRISHGTCLYHHRPYTPPQPTGGRCPHCGACVLVREYRDGAYIVLPKLLTLALGAVHTCDTRKEEGYESHM